jgi:hypothetical protein
MWSGIVVVALVAVAPAAGLLVNPTGDDDAISPIVVAAPATEGKGGSASAPAGTRETVVDDGIPSGDGARAAKAALERYGGRALTIERDGALYDVELQRADGRIVEVQVDRHFRVVGVEGAAAEPD